MAEDELLSKPFSSVGDWPYHIERMTQFWWIKLGRVPYMFSQYSPIPKHFYSGFNKFLLQRWLNLLEQTLKQAQVNEEQLHKWMNMATRIGDFLVSRNKLFAEHLSSKGQD